MILIKLVRVLLVCLVAVWLASAASAAPVLLISIDGLRPGDVFEAEKRGLKIPNLRRFVTNGSYADSVTGVLPTVTYPSHTTILTGVSPARHGIVSNTTFDPLQINAGGWYWYASDIAAPTLWDAAQASGKVVANVHWPVSVGAKGITWNLPQIWRTGHRDDDKLVRALSTPGLLDSLEATLGRYAPGIDESIEGDETRGRFAARLIADKKPDFMTVYLTALDHEQHAAGPGSAQAHAVLERIDTIIGALVVTASSARSDIVIAIVSDHGFAATTTEINLFRPFMDAGLIVLDGNGKIKSWEAMPWVSGGSAAVVLARPDDAALTGRVSRLLAQLAANPVARIDRVIDRSTIAALQGNPTASFYVNFAAGALAGGFQGSGVPLAKPATAKGMHGYFPAAPDMRSTFLLMGPGIAAGRSYGAIDMRAIAPTLASIMDIALPTAEQAALPR